MYVVGRPNLGIESARFTFDAFRVQYLDNSNDGTNGKIVLEKQLRNRVRKCPKCFKSCGESMVLCNGCSYDISNVECSYTTNVFTLFICSVEKLRNNIPLSISLRYESEDFIVMDDLNAMSLCHLLILPTSFYIPDVRHLFQHPEEGLQLVNKLLSLGIDVFKKQFLSNNEVSKYFYEDCNNKDGQENSFSEQFQKHLICCFNLPPSQFQIHMQFIFNPIVESLRWDCNTSHFLPGRCLLTEYVIESLSKLVELNTSIIGAATLNTEELINQIYKKTNVNYETYMVNKFAGMYDIFENSSFYHDNDRLDKLYKYKVVHDDDNNNTVVVDIKSNEVIENFPMKNVTESIKEDKKKLSNFGRRPNFNKSNLSNNDEKDGEEEDNKKVYLSYYSYGKKPPLKEWHI